MIALLAGRRTEAEFWKQRHPGVADQCVYAETASSLIGLELTRVVFIGTFHERSDAEEIERYARSRMRP